MKFIPYGRQFIDKKDKVSVLNSLSNDLITTGPYVKKFENKIKNYLKSKYVFSCSSGTAAIHLAMLAIELKKDDIILMPAMNFIASFNMAKNMGLKIYLVDVDEFTGQITPETILQCINKNKLRKIKALVVMYHGGYPENSKEFFDLKKKFNFFIIEDACHALGSMYKYKNKFYKIGSCKHSDIATFSLHPLKSITSGEGGIIVTNNHKISKNIELYRNHGLIRKKNKYWEYDIIKNGFNYRLSDINCALALSQLNKIDFFLKKRQEIYKTYKNKLEKYNSVIKIPKYSNNIKASFHLFFLNIAFANLQNKKEHLIKYFIKNKILVQQHYIPIYKFKIYKKKNNLFPGSDKFFKNSISIPIFVNMKKREQGKIIKVLKNYF